MEPVQLEAFTQADGEYCKQTKGLHEFAMPVFKKLQRMSWSYVWKLAIVNVGLRIKGSNTERCEKHTHLCTIVLQCSCKQTRYANKTTEMSVFCHIKCLLLTNLIYFVLCKRHKANHHIGIAKHFPNNKQKNK